MALSLLRLKEMKMMSIIREVLFYLLFLYVMMMVGYGNRDPWSVFVYRNLKHTYYVGNQYDGQYDHYNMGKVGFALPQLQSRCNVL